MLAGLLAAAADLRHVKQQIYLRRGRVRPIFLASRHSRQSDFRNEQMGGGFARDCPFEKGEQGNVIEETSFWVPANWCVQDTCPLCACIPRDRRRSRSANESYTRNTVKRGTEARRPRHDWRNRTNAVAGFEETWLHGHEQGLGDLW